MDLKQGSVEALKSESDLWEVLDCRSEKLSTTTRSDNHDTAASMSHDDATKYACVVFDEGGVKWTHNPKAPQVKKVLTD